MSSLPEVVAQVTFLTADEGGRSTPVDLSGGHYRPHLVVGDPNQREPIVRDGNVIDEEYLGVQFVPSDERCVPGEALTVTFQLIYAPRVSYGSLTPGAPFTVREGGRIVAFGQVLERREDAA